MAKKKQRQSYAEPWTGERSQTWRVAFRHGPPAMLDFDEVERRQAELDFEAKKFKAEENAPWIIWGTGLSTPTICTSLLGKVSVSSDNDIILTVHRRGGWQEGQPTHKDTTERVVDCVNAMAGVADPSVFMEEVRELLCDMARGDADRNDLRIGRLYVTCFPNEEIPI